MAQTLAEFAPKITTQIHNLNLYPTTGEQEKVCTKADHDNNHDGADMEALDDSSGSADAAAAEGDSGPGGSSSVTILAEEYAALKAALKAVKKENMINKEILKILDCDASLYGGKGPRRHEGEKASEHLARLQQEQQQSHELRETRLSLWNSSIF
jgi:hypothetical protein